MISDDYLLQYIDPMQKKIGSCFSVDWQKLILRSDFYYPFYLDFGIAISSLGRSDLLEALQSVIAIEYKHKNLSKADIQGFADIFQQLKNEQIWRHSEMDRLTAALTDCKSEQGRIAAELVENQVEQRRLCVELESCLEKLSLLENQTAILNANLVEMRESNSWKITKPLRWFSRLIKSMRVSES